MRLRAGYANAYKKGGTFKVPLLKGDLGGSRFKACVSFVCSKTSLPTTSRIGFKLKKQMDRILMLLKMAS